MFKTGRARTRFSLLALPLLLVVSLVVWQAATVLADAPHPNKLDAAPPDSVYAPVAEANIGAPGAAASIHGDPAAGQKLFALECTTCHGDRGVGGVLNPGSSDGTVPPLNPIDPGFYQAAGGDPSGMASGIDLFVQHGSRPAGDSPKLNMVGWGDHKMLNQQQIADLEAYVMQLNGVYWPDRWNPPASIQVDATQKDNLITYKITVVNQGASAIGRVDVRDTLPAGLAYVSSYLLDVGQNPGAVAGSTVEWINDNGVPQGGTFGPFVIVAQVTGAKPPPNTVQLLFNWTGLNGTVNSSSVVSDPIVPKSETANATPVPVTTAVPASPVPSTPVPTTTVTSNGANPTATPASVAGTPTSAPTAAPIATPTPAAAQPATVGAQIVQPSEAALSWGYVPPTITIHVGDTVIWTNQGSLQHTVTADDGSFDSGLYSTGATWSMTFNTAGTYNYHCAPHPWMKGSVVVQ